MLGLPAIEDSEVVLDARFNAGIYGLADEATLKAIKIVRLFPSRLSFSHLTGPMSLLFNLTGRRDGGLHHRSGLRGKEHGWFDLVGRVARDPVLLERSVYPLGRTKRVERSGERSLSSSLVLTRLSDLSLSSFPFSQCALA